MPTPAGGRPRKESKDCDANGLLSKEWPLFCGDSMNDVSRLKDMPLLSELRTPKDTPLFALICFIGDAAALYSRSSFSGNSSPSSSLDSSPMLDTLSWLESFAAVVRLTGRAPALPTAAVVRWATAPRGSESVNWCVAWVQSCSCALRYAVSAPLTAF
jgi:hypothetical protein